MPFSGWQLPHLEFGRDWNDGGDWIALSGLAASRRDQVPQGARARLGRRLRGSVDAIGSSFLGWRSHVATNCHGGLRREWVAESDWVAHVGWQPLVATNYHWGRGRVWVDGSDWTALFWLAAPRRDQLPQGARARLGRQGTIGSPLLGRQFQVATSCHRGRGRDRVGGIWTTGAIGPPSISWQFQLDAPGGVGWSAGAIGSPFLGWRLHVAASCLKGRGRYWVGGCPRWDQAWLERQRSHARGGCS